MTTYAWVLFSLIGFKAHASGNSIEIVIPVIQDFYIQSDSTGVPALVGNYELCTEETDSPMPEGSKNGRFQFSIHGNNTSNEINLLGRRAGVYHYILKQITEDADKYKYDRTVYTITVYIENTPDGQFTSQVVVENGEAGKCAEIRFKNQYINDNGTIQPPETGNQSNLLFWELLCLSSFVGLIALAIIRRKQIS